MYRLFVAIDFPAPVKRELLSICNGLKGARWVKEDQLHLTLRFIGEVDGSVLRDVTDSLSTIEMPVFDLAVEGVGFFPPRRAPEILWAGLRQSDQLLQLRNKVESALQQGGLAPDGRKFKGHITLARLKSTPSELVASYLTMNSLFGINPFPIVQFHLYSSFLASEGAIHTIEASYKLGLNERFE